MGLNWTPCCVRGCYWRLLKIYAIGGVISLTTYQKRGWEGNISGVVDETMGDAVCGNVSIGQKQWKMNCIISHSVVLSVIEAFQSTTRKIIGCFHNGRSFNKCSIIHPTSLLSSVRALACAIDALLHSYCRLRSRFNLPAMEDWTFQFATCRAALKCLGENERDDFGWGWKQRLCGRHYTHKSPDESCIHSTCLLTVRGTKERMGFGSGVLSVGIDKRFCIVGVSKSNVNLMIPFHWEVLFHSLHAWENFIFGLGLL